MGVLTAAELNFLVFRYLQESGFIHAAFTLGYEAGIHKGGIDGNAVPPGALITIVQKGLQYIELEANTEENDEEIEKDFALLEPLEIITKDVEELQQLVKKRKRERSQTDREKDRGKEKERNEEHERRPGGERERDRHDKEKEQVREKDKSEKDREHEKEKEKEKQHTERIDKVKHEEDSLAGGGPTPMDVSVTAQEISSTDVTVLEGHSSEVFACAWSPTGSLLASGSGDSTARIWTIPDGPCGSSMQSSPPGVHVLKHFKGRTNEKSKDVTTLDWNGEGTLLATGSYDGQARIWSRDGELKQTLFKHKGPIFSLKWNKKGDYLLSGSVDKTAIVWDTKTWECKQQFEFHSAPTLDVDWRNNNSFATCSTDSMIYVCKIGEQRPVKSFIGHQSEVNAIKWDPTGSFLASCSDDWTAKIWSMKQDKCVFDFKEHTKCLSIVNQFSFTKLVISDSHYSLQSIVMHLMRGTHKNGQCASFDSTIKLWEVEQGRLLYSLAGHRQPVYSVAFSPDGEYLASGSLDQCLHIWSVKEGRILKTYRGTGGIFEVCWNKEGSKIAACFSNNTVCVMDFRM
ncbi:F-box-like/WD repeat-containing protein TBL1XR1 [Panicum miliaceum]|uniref:F-box-like/WD repeat-containing protein TBL1XR1 n=1 Tax=Panicum miliaceum TaxID=4540 RepID=A0A3L6PX13_PANMI|nr:F-box-like/WD repeat-containing protein TBL1XR1 [Panicum miliaceum]